MVTDWSARFARTSDHPVGNVEVLEASHLLSTRARRPCLSAERLAEGPAPWLSRVESLELRSSQRKAPSVRREQPSLRGDVGSSDLGPGHRDSLISTRAAATRVTSWCPDSPRRVPRHLLTGAADGSSHGVVVSATEEGKAGGGSTLHGVGGPSHPVHRPLDPDGPHVLRSEALREGRRGPPECPRERAGKWARSSGMTSSCGVPGEESLLVRSRGEQDPRSERWSLRPVVPIGDEPVDLLRWKARSRDWSAGKRATWIGSARLLDRRRTIAPSTPERLDGNPARADGGQEAHPHPRERACIGEAGRPAQAGRRRGRKNPRRPPCPHPDRSIHSRSCPECSPHREPSAEARSSSGTGVTRRLLMEETRVLSPTDCHRR